MKLYYPVAVTTVLLTLAGGTSVALAQTDAPVVDEHHLEEPSGATTATPDDPTMPAPSTAEGGMPGMTGMMEMMGPQMMRMMQMMSQMQGMQEMRMQQMEQMQERMRQMLEIGSTMGMGAGADPSAMMGRDMTMCPMMMPGMMDGMMGGAGMGMRPGAMTDTMSPGGLGMAAGALREMTPELVREWLTRWLARHGVARLEIGEIASAEDGSIVAEIVTVDGSLVQKLAFNQYPGLFRQVD